MANTLEEDLKERVMDLIRKLPLREPRRELILSTLADEATVITEKQLKTKLLGFLKCVMINGDPKKLTDQFISEHKKKRARPADDHKKSRSAKKGKI